MNEQVSSDGLSGIKTLAALAKRHGKGLKDVDPKMVLALVECAEILARQCDTGCQCEDCIAGRLALAKLEAI